MRDWQFFAVLSAVWLAPHSSIWVGFGCGLAMLIAAFACRNK